MAALTADRDTLRLEGAERFVFPVKAATTIYAGSLVVLDAGYAAPGRTATGLRAIGRAEARVANAGAAGAEKIEVRRGCFRFGNSGGGDLIALTEVGAACYIVDDQTVAKTDGSGTRSIAGIVRDVDTAGVWVEF